MRGVRVLRLAVALAAALGLSACQDEGREMERIIAAYGFQRNVPPSTLYGPGTLVYRQNYDPRVQNPGSVQIDYLCTTRYSVDLYEHKPRISDTESRDVANKIGGSFNLGLPALRTIFNLTATAKAARSVTATISDAKIYTYAPDELSEIRSLLRPVCRDIVNRNIASSNAYQVLKVLEATVDLRVTFDASASAGLKVQAQKELLNAGFTLDPASDTLVTKGKALYYGVALLPLTRL
jgi:hypothetical protein